MSTINFKLSDAELEVMRILWREKQAVSFSDIRTELSDTVGWEKSTIATLLRRLQKKGCYLDSGKRDSLLCAEYNKRRLYHVQEKKSDR
nr:BlaI/MecI/CopY family transcriptional regulator [uncultured Acetatifactor sp.]